MLRMPGCSQTQSPNRLVSPLRRRDWNSSPPDDRLAMAAIKVADHCGRMCVCPSADLGNSCAPERKAACCSAVLRSGGGRGIRNYCTVCGNPLTFQPNHTWVPLAVRLPCNSHGNAMKLARPKRFELLTPKFVVWCSIQLSYGRFVPAAVISAAQPGIASLWTLHWQGLPAARARLAPPRPAPGSPPGCGNKAAPDWRA